MCNDYVLSILPHTLLSGPGIEGKGLENPDVWRYNFRKATAMFTSYARLEKM